MTFPPIESSPLSFPSVKKVPNLDEQKIWLSHQNIYAERIVADWKDWTPTYTNLTIGDGTVVARYVQIGKLVAAQFEFTLGSTSAVGTDPTILLPVAANSLYTSLVNWVGQCMLNDTGTARYQGRVSITSDTHFSVRALNAAGTYLVEANVTATVPFTWTTTDVLGFSALYEAA